MDLIVDVRDEAGHKILAVTGEADVYTAHTLRHRFTDLVASGVRTLIVDLREVESLDSNASACSSAA
jgi:anti-anti-sigma factor